MHCVLTVLCCTAGCTWDAGHPRCDAVNSARLEARTGRVSRRLVEYACWVHPNSCQHPCYGRASQRTYQPAAFPRRGLSLTFFLHYFTVYEWSKSFVRHRRRQLKTSVVLSFSVPSLPFITPLTSLFPLPPGPFSWFLYFHLLPQPRLKGPRKRLNLWLSLAAKDI